jgi:hypothetical protein
MSHSLHEYRGILVALPFAYQARECNDKSSLPAKFSENLARTE